MATTIPSRKQATILARTVSQGAIRTASTRERWWTTNRRPYSAIAQRPSDPIAPPIATISTASVSMPALIGSPRSARDRICRRGCQGPRDPRDPRRARDPQGLVTLGDAVDAVAPGGFDGLGGVDGAVGAAGRSAAAGRLGAGRPRPFRATASRVLAPTRRVLASAGQAAAPHESGQHRAQEI